MTKLKIKFAAVLTATPVLLLALIASNSAVASAATPTRTASHINHSTVRPGCAATIYGWFATAGDGVACES